MIKVIEIKKRYIIKNIGRHCRVYFFENGDYSYLAF